jgi:iron(III) transport system ATP-binding protein
MLQGRLRHRHQDADCRMTSTAHLPNPSVDPQRCPEGLSILAIDELTVRYGATAALDRVSLEIARGEVVCLLGPSGSGKSTLLRVVSGVDRPTSGRIVIDGVEVAGPRTFVEPECRRVGMVFQDYALFPHLTVEANVGFGLRQRRAVVAGLLSRLGLEKFAQSYPHRLSGGERQRVALARAMAPAPQILLMDEPFSSLDSRLRDDVRRQTLDFLRESRTTTVIVTHDPDEAMRIGDRIALLDAGRLVQFGPAEELYSRPHTLFAARFFSDVTALPGVCRNGRFETLLGTFPAPDLASGASGIACVRPEHLWIVSRPAGVAARVLSSEFRGESRHILVKVEGVDEPVAVSAPRRGTNGQATPAEFAPGAAIHLEIGADDVPVIASL